MHHGRSAPTPLQRAEREQAAKRKLEEEIEARAELLRRRARQRTEARKADRARRQPSTPLRAAVQEAARRAGAPSTAPRVDASRETVERHGRYRVVRGWGAGADRCDARPRQAPDW